MPTNSRKSKCEGRHFSNISFLESISEGGKLQKKQVKPAKSGILFIESLLKKQLICYIKTVKSNNTNKSDGKTEDDFIESQIDGEHNQRGWSVTRLSLTCERFF